MYDPKKIRNIAIIAHIDHGKTTLLDNLLRQSNIFRDNEKVNPNDDTDQVQGMAIKPRNSSNVSRPLERVDVGEIQLGTEAVQQAGQGIIVLLIGELEPFDLAAGAVDRSRRRKRMRAAGGVSGVDIEHFIDHHVGQVPSM